MFAQFICIDKNSNIDDEIDFFFNKISLSNWRILLKLSRPNYIYLLITHIYQIVYTHCPRNTYDISLIIIHPRSAVRRGRGVRRRVSLFHGPERPFRPGPRVQHTAMRAGYRWIRHWPRQHRNDCHCRDSICRLHISSFRPGNHTNQRFSFTYTIHR